MNKKIFTVLVLMMVVAVSCFAQQRGLFLDFDNETITVREMESLDEEEVKNGFYYETADGVFRLYQGKVCDTHSASLRDAATSALPTTPWKGAMTVEKMRKQAELLEKMGASEEEKGKLADLIAQAEENDRKYEERLARNARMLALLDEALNELYGVGEDDWR